MNHFLLMLTGIIASTLIFYCLSLVDIRLIPLGLLPYFFSIVIRFAVMEVCAATRENKSK